MALTVHNLRVPWVSVIIAAYNAAPYVEQCLESVLSQRMRDLEIICVNDGSTDETGEILGRMALADDRIHAITQPNAGPGAARNAALDAAQGRYALILDADDYLAPHALDAARQITEKTDADLLLFAFRTFNQAAGRTCEADWSNRHLDLFPAYPGNPDVFTWQAAPDYFFETVQSIGWNKLIARDLLDREGIRFSKLHLTEDLMYSIPAAVSAQRIVRTSSELLVHREFSGTNAMADKSAWPLDVVDAFAQLKAWLEQRGVYDALRVSYQNWLLDALYYNLPTYTDLSGFRAAYDILTHDGLRAFDLAEVDQDAIHDHRYKAMYRALKDGADKADGAERFLLALANIEAQEVQEQKRGFQIDQGSAYWLLDRMRERILRS